MKAKNKIFSSFAVVEHFCRLARYMVFLLYDEVFSA